MAKYCTNCHKAIKPQYELCWDCKLKAEEVLNWLAYQAKSEQEKEDEEYRYQNTLCDNCGKEGAYPRKDGSNMCSNCWTVWNS